MQKMQCNIFSFTLSRWKVEEMQSMFNAVILRFMCAMGWVCRMKRFIGLRNIVTSKTDWKYLMLYEIDSHDDYQLGVVTDHYRRMETSYIVYSTLNGFHFVGLTPMNAQKWGIYFQRLQNSIPEYFSGQTLRLSLKEGENQRLIEASFNYPFLQRLAFMYCRRFNITKSDIPIYDYPPNYVSVFERYWTGKI